MKDLVIPISCKTRDKVLRYYALFVAPILGVVGVLMFPKSSDQLAHFDGVTLILCFIAMLHLSVFGAMLLSILLENSHKLPKIRCKCDDDK